MEFAERTSRVITEDSAADMVRDGMTIAFGEPYPMALIRAIIRRKVQNLTVICSGVALDVLIATGCAKKVIAYYAGGGTGIPVAPNFRVAAEANDIEVWECDEGILCSGLEASAKDLPYLPWRGGVGTSIPELNKDLKLITDPFHGETLIAVPAIRPDITFLHAAHSDRFGNVQHIGGPGWLDLFLHRAAVKTVVQVEKFISNEEIRATAWHTTIDNVDGLVCTPHGAHPFYSRGHYLQDVEFIDDYLQAASGVATGERQQLDAFLHEYFYSCHSHFEYIDKIGSERLNRLREY